ncbi:MAG TPA: WxL domain-containing protein [Chloroflexia bacterium]|nr:WxL domain-containing protein [Chloroflexia bacterium]
MFKKHLKVSVAAMCVMAALVPTAAFAADTTVTVNGGALSISAPTVATFTAVNMDGTAKETNAAVGTFSVTDARGNGNGWHVTASASQFAEWSGTAYVTDVKTLAAGSLELSEPSATANGTDSPAPTVSSGPYTIDSGSGVSVASAAVDEGMGKYDFGATSLTLSIPADAYARTYKSTVTISVTTAP